MKQILILICFTALVSCKKESTTPQTCFTCKYALTAGVQKPDDIRCTNGEAPPITYDGNGNPIGQFCEKR